MGIRAWVSGFWSFRLNSQMRFPVGSHNQKTMYSKKDLQLKHGSHSRAQHVEVVCRMRVSGCTVLASVLKHEHAAWKTNRMVQNTCCACRRPADLSSSSSLLGLCIVASQGAPKPRPVQTPNPSRRHGSSSCTLPT